MRSAINLTAYTALTQLTQHRKIEHLALILCLNFLRIWLEGEYKKDKNEIWDCVYESTYEIKGLSWFLFIDCDWHSCRFDKSDTHVALI